MLSAPLLVEFKKRDKKLISKSYSRTADFWAHQKWLNPNNRYIGNGENLAKDFTVGKKIRHKHLREYIAASTTVHSMDGWSYLSRAVDAQLAGDHDCSRHLSYYAELRAAMSILGAHGIGVFNNEHAAVDAKGNCIRLGYTRKYPDRPHGPGTHQFVWDALSEWAKSSDASDAVLHAVHGGGQPMSEWVSHFAAGRALSSRLAKRWLLAWGLDISFLANDRDSRNLSSYRPTAFTSPRPIKVENGLDFAFRLWRGCEPIAGNPFVLLDQEILRASIYEAYHSAYANHAGGLSFADRIDGLLQKLQPTGPAGSPDWKTYFLDDAAREAGIPSIAKKTDDPSSPDHSIQVAARALLLLRIATAACSDLISEVPTAQRDHLNSLVEQLGEDRGFWEPGKMPEVITDLWQDSEDAIAAVEADLPNIKSYHYFWRRQSSHAVTLTECERAGIWGICG